MTGIAWYRPIEPYIDSTTQIIAANGKIYVATTKGLIVLNAETGAGPLWRFDTELPLNTPTVVNGVVYVAGLDRRLYALNAETGSVIWTFESAGAGYNTNPLVINGIVYIGNRDGKFYAVNASNGQAVWSYLTGGAIMQSAAYDNGAIYFASQDMYGYALNASNGVLIWRTPQKLPGEQYQSWWPVIYDNYVVYSGASAYQGTNPGGATVASNMHEQAFFGETPTSNFIGNIFVTADTSLGWPAGSRVVDTRQGPAGNPYTLRSYLTRYPHRRVFAVVNKSNGVEPFTIPYLLTGNFSGNQYPPVVNPNDGVLYINNLYQNGSIPRSMPMGWKPGNDYLLLLGNRNSAYDEPQAWSLGNTTFYYNLCCDREAGAQNGRQSFWSYSSPATLSGRLPSQRDANAYDPMWAFYDGEEFLQRLGGYYKGNTNSRNGTYHNHGLQNPLIPYAFVNSSGQRVERLFTHRSNTIVALGETASKTPLPVVAAAAPSVPATTLQSGEITRRLEREIRKMVDLYVAYGVNGFLRPGYYNDDTNVSTALMPEGNFYFQNPTDTLYTLSAAYPHISDPILKQRLLNYLRDYFLKYFGGGRIIRQIGWNIGQPRESMVHAPEVLAEMSRISDSTSSPTGFLNQRLLYAAWKYAQINPSDALTIYRAVRPALIFPAAHLGQPLSSDILNRFPFAFNDFIAGYQGFINLYDLANPGVDGAIRANVQVQLNQLLVMRTQQFAKDHPWEGSVDNPTGIVVNNYVRQNNLNRNFLYLTAELGDYMAESLRAVDIRRAIDEYVYLGPFWFMARGHNNFQETSARHLYDSPAILAAKAHIQRLSMSELSKYIDVPAFEVGDLLYLQNLVTALSARQDTMPAPTTTDVQVNVVALSLSPNSVVAGSQAVGMVRLDEVAPPEGQPVILSSSSPVAIVPASVLVPAGFDSVEFPVNTASPLASNDSATITAVVGASIRSATLTLIASSSGTPTPSIPGTVSSNPSVDGSIIIDHRSVVQFSQIPDEFIRAAGQSSLLFRHASVGNNISDGLNCLANTFPDRTSRPYFCDRGLASDQIVFDPKYNRSNWTFEYHSPPPGINPGWWDKQNFFINRVETSGDSFDVVGFKFGYVDGFTGSNIDERFFDRVAGDGLPGIETLEALEARHPSKRFMYWTMGLSRAATVDMQNFNLKMRGYAAANGKILFDLAAIQSHRPDGTRCFDNAGRGVEAICSEYTDEVNAGHLNTLGKLQVAKAIWVMMAKLAGWSQ